MKYRKLHGYKYELMQAYTHIINATLPPNVGNEYVSTGVNLYISAGYAWDGASGPTWDDKTNMRASLVHDALYQLMREGLLDRKYRKYADELLRDMCIQDGMGKFRAAYYYRAVRIFGARTCLPEKNPRGQVITI